MARVVIDFEPEAINNLDNLKDRIGLKTRTELVRHALALLDLAEAKKRDGYRLQFKRGESIIEVAHLF